MNNDLNTLIKALMPGNIDNNSLIRITLNNSLANRLILKNQYNLETKIDLIEDFSKKLKGDFKDLLIALYTDPVEFDCESLKKATKGLGTDEDTLIEIISSRTNEQLKNIIYEYKNIYKKSLKEDIYNDTSGIFRDLLMELLKCNRSEKSSADIKVCKEIAEELYSACKGKFNKDANIFIKYFSSLSKIELQIVAQEFYKLKGQSLKEAIEKNFSFDSKKTLIAILYSLISPNEYFATRIKDALKGPIINDKILIRVFSSRNEIDMDQIKIFYKVLYKKDLIEDIKNKLSGDYKELIIGLLNKK